MAEPKEDYPEGRNTALRPNDEYTLTASDKVECPYCGATMDFEMEAPDEEEEEFECEECEMKFWLQQNITIDNHARSDCKLNGAEHRWEPTVLSEGEVHDFCADCRECRSYDGSEEKYKKPPCVQCGAMTLEEAEGKCTQRANHEFMESRDCHGMALWPE